jgi:uncharacterized membrane protein YfcA
MFPEPLQTLAALAWPSPAMVLAIGIGISFGAGLVRGFSGFGYSALVVAGLSPFVWIGPVIAAVLILEAVASARVVGQVRADIDRTWHSSTLLGNLLFVPLGLAAISWLNPDTVRIVLSALVLAGAAMLRLSVGRRFESTRIVRSTAGAASGLLNGFAASGGIVAALMMAACGVAPHALRATMISVLLWISLYALACSAVLAAAGGGSLLGAEAVGWAILLWPSMALGIRMGTGAFRRADMKRQVLTVLNVLMIVAAAALVTGLRHAWTKAA